MPGGISCKPRLYSMLYNITIAIACLFCADTFAQIGESTIRRGDTTVIYDKVTGKEEIFTYVEQMPQAPYDVLAYLAKNIQLPGDAVSEGISGKVYVKFIIRQDGSIDSARVVRGLSPSLDKEVLRVIRAMPPWKPGRQNGKAVDVYYTLPVTIRLE